MPADEVTHGTDVDESRVRTGPRHAAPKKPLFTRFHMPAGKAIAMAAMPTAVLMGMGFTSSLALADNNSSSTPTAKSLTADEYKNCVAALDGSKDKASASPTPSASASDSAKDGKDSTAEPTPSATSAPQSTSPDKTSSPDSGSGDKATAEPKPSSTAAQGASGSSGSAGSSGSGGDTSTATPSASASSGGGLLHTIGDTIGSILTGGSKPGSGSGSSTPSAAPSATASKDGASSGGSAKDSSSGSSGKSASDTVKNTAGQVTGTVKDTVKGTTDTASKAAEDTTKKVADAAGAATASPSPSASSTTASKDCPAATDAQGGVDNKVPLADDPWYLDASSLLLKGADYKGVVEVRTANGTVKKVLKYVISAGTDIGDLHQTVKDPQSGKTYHVQAAPGSTSTIRNGDTVMYTESISGNLLGLIPVTFSPDNPPPLNIPLIYFTKVRVVQAGQFGGDLHVPGMHVYTTG
ncbi:hypothetical protein [Streptomyces sp. NPDC046197]|uniref:hypothetical protein n=1 Tax=Streptomyces sp. NPDC046197 TaxID=3154337 RepID=UPI0033C1AD96